jgi:RNA recognition motif-containing protein
MDDYTVQVCNLSPKATMKDVKQFFSYSGTVKKVKLERAGQWAQVAFVTFKEPYALETAVLLSGATIIDQKVCIVPWGGSEEAVSRWKKQKLQEEGNTQGASSFIPSAEQAVNVVTTMLSKGYTLGKDTLSKANELDQKYQVINTATAKVTSFGKFVGEKSKAALIVAGQAASSAGTTAVNSSYFASGALMVSGALTKAAKAAADLGTRGNTVT